MSEGRCLQCERDRQERDELRADMRALAAAVRALRADMRHGELLGALRDALEDEMAGAAFTVAGLLEIADTERDNPITIALGELIDLAAPARSRATALGRLLAIVPWLERRGDRRGAVLYVLRT